MVENQLKKKTRNREADFEAKSSYKKVYLIGCLWIISSEFAS